MTGTPPPARSPGPAAASAAERECSVIPGSSSCSSRIVTEKIGRSLVARPLVALKPVEVRIRNLPLRLLDRVLQVAHREAAAPTPARRRRHEILRRRLLDR